MSRTWVRISSWHAVKRVDAGGWWTECGRLLLGDRAVFADELPAEKSCELCLRITARQDDETPPDDVDGGEVTDG